MILINKRKLQYTKRILNKLLYRRLEIKWQNSAAQPEPSTEVSRAAAFLKN